MAAQTTADAAERWSTRSLLLERVLDAHGPLLRRDSRRHTRCSADADAAFSDGCYRFLSYFQGGDDVDHALRWLRLAIRHSASAHLAAQRREAPTEEIPEHLAPGQPVAGGLDHRERLSLLAALKPDERTALQLLAAGYSYAEIAELRGWTYTKVNRCIAEGRAALRRIEGGEK